MTKLGSGDSAKNPTLNLAGLVVLIADSNSYLRQIVHVALRGFGATKLLEAGQAKDVLEALSAQKIDALLCDARLPPDGGLALIRAIRRGGSSENRTIPILVMTSDLREATIKRARDAGANMVIAKPISPKHLYDRLAWMALNRRKFIDAPNYFGPDRRFKIEGYPGGVGRRAEDKAVDVAAEAGPALAQDDIDSLFRATRKG